MTKQTLPPRSLLRCLPLAALALLLFRPASTVADPQAPPTPWWKGNLHTHSLWSDGDDYPEMIALWYKTNGYHFLAFSDHNVLSEGTRWIDAEKSRGGMAAYHRYLETFGPHWVAHRIDAGKTWSQLKPLNEFRHLFEEPQRFLLIQSEEITDRYKTAPIHLNASNLRHFIPPQGGDSVVEVMENNVRAVLAQREETGQIMVPHLNHPNFGYAITAEELMQVQSEQFFEVYNGHPAVHNEGDDHHAGTERMWDIILSFRLGELNYPILFGIAVDDAHNYHRSASNLSNPGRGWIMVRSHFLTPEHILTAMEQGDFYASTGVQLREIQHTETALQLHIQQEEGVTYTTQFIGTRRSFDRSNEPIRNPAGEPLRLTHRYSKDVGAVLAEVEGTSPAYQFQGDELYVRAKVISTKPKENPYQEGEREVAWIQPIQPK